MGQRANYIIKEDDNLTIHYNHWRANCIASDLYLGEKRFLDFVGECQLNEAITDEPWIEGCVIIDKTNRQLYFWTLEFSKETSVVEYYIKELIKNWNGWQITMLKNRMYDAECILGIQYISSQELPKLYIRSEDDIVSDKVDDWETAVVILKDDNHKFVTKTGNLNIEAIISYGQDEQAGGGYNGNNGVSSPVLTLPVSKVKINFPTYRLILDPASDNRKGVIPNVQPLVTIKDIIQTRDVEMETILNIIKSNK